MGDCGRSIGHLLDDRALIEGRCHRDADAAERSQGGRLLLRGREQPRPLRIVASDLGSANDDPFIVENRRDGQRDWNERAILALTNGLVVPHRFARANLPQHEVFLALTDVRNDDADRLPDRLGGRVAEHALSGRVPRQDDSV